MRTRGDSLYSKVGILFLIALCGSSIHASEKTENQDRQVDQAAVISQDQAIAKLKALLKKSRPGSTEALLMMRLADAQITSAQLKFRIAHGKAKRQAINLNAYRDQMSQSIGTLNQVIAKFPDLSEMPRALLIRAKAYDEIEKKDLAKKDFLQISQRFPDSEEAIAAWMVLADYAVADNQHEQAIQYLDRVIKRPENPQYPFALYKMAWSYYNLKKYDQAIATAKTHVRFYDGFPDLQSSDLSFRENMLLDTVVFFAEATEKATSLGLPAERYSVAQALKLFRDLEKGPVLGKMMLRFAKLLRSQGQEESLLSWTDIVLKEERERPEVLDVLLTTFENQINRKRQEQFAGSLERLKKLYQDHKSWPSWNSARKLLTETIAQQQEWVVKNKAAEGVQGLAKVLADLTLGYLAIVEKDDVRTAIATFNLAETYYELSDYETAVQYYSDTRQSLQQIQTPSSAKAENHPSKQLTPVQVRLRMISARYETLKKQKVFPENLEPKPMNQTRVAQWKKSDQLAEEWVTWLSEPEVSQAPDRGPFWFEAQRMLYERSAILSSTDELEKLALKDPDAEYAIASASLVLDTWVVSQEWTKVISTAQEFQSVAAWKKLPFYSKTLALVATAELKQIEIGLKERKPDETLALVQKWVKKHPESELKGSALWIAFETAYVHEQWDRSLELSSQILSETEKKLTDEQRWTLHARRGILFEKRLDFVEAIHAWTKQDSLKKDPALRIKMLTWAVVFEDSKLIQSVRETACESKSTKPASDPLCAQAQVWQSYLEAYSPGHTIDKAAAKKALELAKDGPEHSRAIWSSIAFAQLEGFNYRDRMSAVRQFVLHLEKLPEALQISLIRQAGPKVVRAFELNRTQMDTIAPLRANPNYIVARMEIIKSMETVATHAMKLPWRALHAGVLREIAALYVDVGSGIRRVSGKKSDQALDEQIAQLIMPLEEKGQDLLAKAFEIASNSLLTSAEIDRVAEPYFASNPSTASKLKQSRAPAQTLIWGWDRWQRRKNDWTPSEKLFSQAIQQSRFALGFTLLKLLPEANQAEARIALLQKLGAQSEALSFLEHHLGALGQPSDSEPRRWAREHWSELASIASQSYAFKKAEDYRAEIAKFEATAAPAAPTTPVTATPMQPQALQRSPSSKAGKSQTKN